MSEPDLVKEPLEIGQIRWLLSCGVPAMALVQPEPIFLVRGTCETGRYFEAVPDGDRWLAIQQSNDVVCWQPRSGEFATWTGHAFAWNEDAIDNPATYAFDSELRVHSDPIEWLAAGQDGIVIFDWSAVFDRLRHAPRVAVTPHILQKYQAAMRPVQLPELSVMVNHERAAA